MATVRQWLNEAGFNWDAGVIVYHPVGDEQSPGWADAVGAEIFVHHSWGVEAAKEFLDREFETGYGGPKAPRFIAFEAGAFIYFPSQYDGATWLTRVSAYPTFYMDWKNNATPYPGG